MSLPNGLSRVLVILRRLCHVALQMVFLHCFYDALELEFRKLSSRVWGIQYELSYRPIELLPGGKCFLKGRIVEMDAVPAAKSQLS